ncbi:flagellar hook-basal body protein [Anaerobacillus sp. MEB173]|uniref:flagellar hook-basal body protein n=1 Tax=Anaerobacillus sp. MEB173 TaxID=3383345 RepID=UPI003F925120
MNLSMLTASSTMGQLQKKIDTISNNMANSSTTGYKRRDSQFSDLLFQQVNNQPQPYHEINRQTPNGIRVGSGAKVAQTNIRMDQGAVQTTGRALDLALNDKGQFFQIQVSNGNVVSNQLTRDGAFYLTPSSTNPDLLNVVTSEGHYLLGNNGPITIPANYSEIIINQNGQVVAQMANGTSQVIDTIEIATVHRPQLLQQMGDNRFALPNLAELDINQADVIEIVNPAAVRMTQGALEGSNVDLAKEMSDLLVAQRSYQFNAKAINLSDQMMGLINGIR